jgi:hypothetical protein
MESATLLYHHHNMHTEQITDTMIATTPFNTKEDERASPCSAISSPPSNSTWISNGLLSLDATNN